MTNAVTKLSLIILFIATSLFSPFIFAQANFSAYMKSYALVQNEITVAGSDQKIERNFQSQNSLRLMGTYFFEAEGNIEIHYEVQPLYFSRYNPFSSDSPIEGDIGSTLSVGANQYRLTDLNPVLSESGGHTVVLQNLDRLNYRYSTDAGDLTLGRQVISFGSARFINPTDIFIPFSIQTLNQEYRIGIDAIRFQAEMGDFAVLDSGIIIGEDAKKENSALFIRGKNSIAGNDIEAVAIALDEAALIGAGIERAIGDVGFWFEAAYMFYSSTKKDDVNTDDTNYWRSSIGADYAIVDNVILMMEYHYNGAGESFADDYLKNRDKEAYQKEGVFLNGKHYLIPAISWLVSPLIVFTGSGFFNLSDDSIFFNIVTEVSWSDNLYSDVGLYLSTGDGLGINNSNPIPAIDIGSEFGAYPASMYASLRYYF